MVGYRLSFGKTGWEGEVTFFETAAGKPGTLPGDNVLVCWLFFLSFAELHEFTLSLILQPVQVHWNGSTAVSISVTPSFVPSTDMKSVRCPIFWIINEDVWGRVLAPESIPSITRPVSYLQPDFVPPISTLWTWLFSQFLIHQTAVLSVFCQLLHESVVGNSV